MVDAWECTAWSSNSYIYCNYKFILKFLRTQNMLTYGINIKDYLWLILFIVTSLIKFDF